MAYGEDFFVLSIDALLLYAALFQLFISICKG
jgi:hypothetical protein